MSRAWIASSTPSSRDSTWNGKPAPSTYLHKQLDVTPECHTTMEMSPSCCITRPPKRRALSRSDTHLSSKAPSGNPQTACAILAGDGHAGENLLPRDLRLPDECPRFRKSRGHAHLPGIPPGALGRRGRSGALQHLLDPRQSRAEGVSSPG